MHEAEKIIRDNRATITSDPFIQTHIAEVLRSLRTQWIVDIIKTYTQISLGYLAAQLAIPVEDVEGLVVALLLDGRVHGKIDQVKQILTLDSQCADRRGGTDPWQSFAGCSSLRLTRSLGERAAPTSGRARQQAPTEWRLADDRSMVIIGSTVHVQVSRPNKLRPSGGRGLPDGQNELLRLRHENRSPDKGFCWRCECSL